MNKAEVQTIIDKVADKIPVFSANPDAPQFKQKEVLIGDVLAYIDGPTNYSTETKLLFLWGECGFKKSLQQIAEKSGFEINGCYDGKHGVEGSNCGGRHPNCKPYERLKDPNARRLFEFLKTIL